MTLGATMVVVFAGFMVATLLFAALARWAALVHGAYKQSAALEPANPMPRTLVLVLCQSLFHGAPWTILTMAFVAYHVRSEQWAPWLFAGFALGAAYMGMIVGVAVLRIRKSAVSGDAHAA